MLTSQNFGSYVTGVAFHPTKNLVASCSSDKSVKLWNADTGAELWTVRGEKSIQCLAFSRNGRILAAGDGYVPGGKDYSIRLYDAESGTQIGCPLRGHNDPVWSVCFSPCGEKIASGGGERLFGNKDYSIRIWDAKTGEQIGSPLNVGSLVWSVRFSPAGDIVAAGCGDGTVQLIDVATAEVKRPLRGHRYAPSLSKECFLSFG